MKTEFYETAVLLGYYGVERSGLTGKKDNVRKYWEDISIKLSLRPYIEKILEKKKSMRVIDLGCGSGEGFELLTHIPVKNHVDSVERGFLLAPSDIELYLGLDISGPMIEQGKLNYTGRDNIMFEQYDLSQGFPLLPEEPFDIYFSSYASLSHLTRAELLTLTGQIMAHSGGYGIIVYDLLGKYSPEWPAYWGKSADQKLPYNMAYLYPEEGKSEDACDAFECSFWSPEELSAVVTSAAVQTGTAARTHTRDRSIFVGRHMDTGIFNKNKRRYRHQVNRLFDRDFRGVLNEMTIDLDFTRDYTGNLSEYSGVRLSHFMRQWNYVIAFIGSLSDSNRMLVNNIIQNIDPSLAEDLDMLSWLHRNASRFPVTDFWASVMGPQIACVLRNFEMNYEDGAGCGHGLFCMTEIGGL